MNVYTEVSDPKTLQALKRLAEQLGSCVLSLVGGWLVR
jgi:hypothetical protein